MSALLAQGRHAEAVNVYRRCRTALLSTLGILPSVETQALIPPTVIRYRSVSPPRRCSCTWHSGCHSRGGRRNVQVDHSAVPRRSADHGATSTPSPPI
ncbi:MAG: hypothetical protein IPK20_16290 [Betaproteobacteria bacterium]|nr:hypothetical protein [Betaproteobacteria bacterium]